MTKQEFLAISLPYGLICDRIFYDIEEFGKESGIHIIDGFDYEMYSDGDIFDLKPILRPLTDLTKEIEHNGEKFVPISVLSKIAYGFTYGKGCPASKKEELLICFPENSQSFFYESASDYLEVFQKLIEWHFDIAGLIEKGEAIDVNTLPENPYK